MSYKDAGVDITAGNRLVDLIKPAVKATARSGAASAIGGFGGVFDLRKAGYKDPLLIAANDGVGTKLRVAIEAGKHDTVGIDLVAMSVNDLVVQGAEPLFFLDYYATGKLDVEVARAVIAGIAKGCGIAGCALIGGETAEMPGMYHGDDYDLAGFAVGAVERRALLPKKTVKPGDVVLGLASSGVHSNGFSLVRRIVEVSRADYGAAAPFDASASLAEALLAPTRIYVKPLLATIAARKGIKALAHITGGGITENLPRVLPAGLAARIDLSVIEPPAVFGWLKAQGGVAPKEMLRTFNCGIGMIVLAEARHADAITLDLADQGEAVTRLGEIVKSGDAAPNVVYDGRLKFA